MITEEKLTTNITNSNSNQNFIWQKELTEEEIAFLEAYHLSLFKDKLEINLTKTVTDLFRNTDSVSVRNKSFSRQDSISLKKVQAAAIKEFNSLLEETVQEDINNISPITKFILCTHNQTWLEKISLEFVSSQNTQLRSVFINPGEIKKTYSKSDNSIGYCQTTKINGFNYANNTEQSAEGEIATISFEENYSYDENKKYIQRKNRKVVITALTEDANDLFPQRTLPVLHAAPNAIVKINLPKTSNTQLTATPSSSFLTECFSNCARLSVNSKEFPFSSIDLASSNQKLLELCQQVFEQFKLEDEKQPTFDIKTTKAAFFSQYQTDVEQSIELFIQEEVINSELQKYLFEQFQPQLAITLKNSFFQDATNLNLYTSAFDLKLEKNTLTIKEKACFFQTNNEHSCFVSANHGPLFSFELTHTITLDPKNNIVVNVSPIALVLHEPLQNFIDVKTQTTAKEITDIFPNMFPKPKKQVSIESSPARSRFSLFSCCLPKAQYQQIDEEETSKQELDEVKPTPKPEPEAATNKNEIDTDEHSDEEQELITSTSSVTLGGTPTSSA